MTQTPLTTTAGPSARGGSLGYPYSRSASGYGLQPVRWLLKAEPIRSGMIQFLA
jgi:hypothetical protein